MNNEQGRSSRQPSVWIGIGLYLGYLAIFFCTWIVNRVDYNRVSESAETIKLWYALPTLFGCAFLVVAISVLGWWRMVLFEPSKSGPKWVWILPVAIAGIILNNFLGLQFSKLSFELLLWSGLGAIGVGFGEEMITRGSMLVGLRSRFPESKVWLISTLLFSALHLPNVLFGLPLLTMPVQLLATFMFGSGLYVIRRISGTLILSMFLHGLWDSSVFLSNATGGASSALVGAAYPIAVICTIALLLKNRHSNDLRQSA